MRATPLPIFGAKCKCKSFKRDKSSSRDFVVRGRPLRGQKRLAPLAKRSTCSKSREQLEGKVKIWKKAIEEKKAALLLCEEIRRKQISTGDEDNMDIAVNLQIDEEALKNYESFSETGYKLFKKVMATACENLCDSFYTEECLDEATNRLRSA